ncbi:MAG TPA: tetratricopeptide repeat protein, partial [Chthoniobacterales bacterium]|nr:tetratricopeptide repeat protein [Chthoniobacterales bacterium]
GELRRNYAGLGPAAIRCASDELSAAKPQPEQSAAARANLTGTVRLVKGKRRVALRLLDNVTGGAIFHGIFELNGNSILPESFYRRTYNGLGAPDLSKKVESDRDPGLLDQECRALITAARELADRRTEIDLQRAEHGLRKAVALQPQSAKAHSELAKILTLRVAYNSDRSFLPAAEEAARRAVALNPDSGESHQALAAVLFHTGLFPGAMEELQQTFERAGVFSRAANMATLTQKALGRPDKAIAWAMVAQKNEPHPSENEATLGDCWSQLAQDDQAEQRYSHFAELHPDQPDGWMGICHLRLLQGKVDEARRLYQENFSPHAGFAYTKQMAAEVEFFGRNFESAAKLYEELLARERDGGGRFYGAVDYRSALARIYMDQDAVKARGLLEEAKEAELQMLERAPECPDALYRTAAIEAIRDRPAAAIDCLRRAFVAGWSEYRSLQADPRFDSLRKQKEFSGLLQEMEARVTSLRLAAAAMLEKENQTRKQP